MISALLTYLLHAVQVLAAVFLIGMGSLLVLNLILGALTGAGEGGSAEEDEP